MHRNRSVDVHRFAMVPAADIPRSSFRMQWGYKTTFNAGFLIPVMCEEVLPGDSFKCSMTAFARLNTPLFPIMDNAYLESFFFYVPNRLVWDNWVKMMGEQKSPGDSISFSTPQIQSPVLGYDVSSLYDYFGLPTVGQVAAASQVTHSALPIRAYALIWNEWFRDQNLVTPFTVDTDDGPDPYTQYTLAPRGKRHDYFTSCLPFAQKGTAVSIPLGGTAPVTTSATATVSGGSPALFWNIAATGARHNTQAGLGTSITTGETQLSGSGAAGGSLIYPANLYADLSSATAQTINALRLAFQTQRLLERDARGGTRYTELLFSHFRVKSPDARLQRPEYLGGGSTPIIINAVPQTSATGATGTPLGNLAAFGTALAQHHGFSHSFVEHGYVIGLINVRADLSYQQGLRRHWSRLTRYDYYWPAFAMLGEQTVLNKEIYCVGGTAGGQDDGVFGYQERWAEYRYGCSQITSLFKSTAAGTLDAWHLSQHFTAIPTLNSTFISEDPPFDRVIATPSEPQFKLDAFFDCIAARPMPLYSVPGMIDHF